MYTHNKNYFTEIGHNHTKLNPNENFMKFKLFNVHRKIHIDTEVEQQHKELSILHDNLDQHYKNNIDISPMTEYTNSNGAGSSKEINKHIIKNLNGEYNNHLDNTGLDIFHKQQEHMSNRLSKSIQTHAKPLINETHVYAGIGGWSPKEHFEKGMVHIPTFTSTSINPNVSKDFSRMKDITPYHGIHDKQNTRIFEEHILHFKLPIGYNKGAYVGNISDHHREKEYLLDKGQKWKIANHEITNRTEFEGYRSKHDKNRPTNKNIKHVHIWTLEPHEDSITEMYVHDINHLSSNNITSVSKEVNNQHNLLRKQFEMHKASSLQTIKDYTTNSSNLNNGLVKLASLKRPKQHYMYKSIKENSVKLSQAIKENIKPLDHEAHVYSGLGFDPKEHFENGGGIIHMPAFTSTSLNPNITKSFSYPRNKTKHLLHIQLPKGYNKGVYIGANNVSQVKGEKEYLLDYNQKFKLVNHEIKKGDADSTQNIHIWSVVPHERLMNMIVSSLEH